MSGTLPPAYPNDAALLMRYDANKRSALIAYLLWFFLGYFGIHRFYLKRTGSGIAMLLIALVSTVLLVVAVGALGYIVVGIWWCIDAFLIPGMTQDYNNRLIAQLRG